MVRGSKSSGACGGDEAGLKRYPGVACVPRFAMSLVAIAILPAGAHALLVLILVLVLLVGFLPGHAFAAPCGPGFFGGDTSFGSCYQCSANPCVKIASCTGASSVVAILACCFFSLKLRRRASRPGTEIVLVAGPGPAGRARSTSRR